MSAVQPRLRMFAGPNGSGKSTLKDVLDPAWLGVYVNADDIEAEIRAQGFVSLAPYGVTATQAGICSPPPSASKRRTQNHSAEGKLSACTKAIALKLQPVGLICPKQ